MRVGLKWFLLHVHWFCCLGICGGTKLGSNGRVEINEITMFWMGGGELVEISPGGRLDGEGGGEGRILRPSYHHACLQTVLEYVS